MRSKKGRGLCWFLTIVMLAELGVAGFRYPGFLRKEPQPGGSTGGYSVSGSGGGTSGGSHSGGGSVRPEENDYYLTDLLSAESISVRYSEQEIAAAPQVSAAVTPENPVAVCGDIRVDLNSWNLDNPEDTLVVRSLPAKTDSATGASYECWDISLASGQNEFYSDVCIHFPVEPDDGPMVDFVTYDDATGQWEPLYSELSADGSEYLVYADHFSPKAKRDLSDSLLGTGSYSGSVKMADFYNSCVTSDAFIELYEKNPDRMRRWVDVLYDVLWNSRSVKDHTDTDIDRAVENMIGALEQMQADQDYTDGLSASGTVSSLIGAGLNVATVARLLPATFGWTTFGNVMAVIDLTIAIAQITDEMSGPNGFQVKDAAKVLDTCGKALSGMSVYYVIVGGTAAASSAVPMAIAGLTIWASSLAVSAMDTGFASLAEEVYESYYSGRDFTFDPPKNEYFGQMRQMSSMTEKDFAALKKTVSKHPLSDDGDSWIPALKTLFKLYKNKPSELPGIVDELYQAYAWSYFMMDDSTRELYEGKELNEWHRGEESKFDPADTGAEKVALSEGRIPLIKSFTANALKQAYLDLERDMQKSVEKLIEKELLPRLNAKMTFTVKDTTLEEGEEFYGSFYGVDYMMIEENSELLRGTTEYSQADCSEIITPMAFAGDPSPEFLPLDYTYEKGSMLNYYPYQPTFIPRAIPGTDVVYTCTLYHYLMMGCPTSLRFTDVSDPQHMDKAEWQEVSFSKIEAPDKRHINMIFEVTPPENDIAGVYEFYESEFDPSTVDPASVLLGLSIGDMLRYAVNTALQDARVTVDASGNFSCSGSGSFSKSLGTAELLEILDEEEGSGNISATLSLDSLSFDGVFDPKTLAADVIHASGSGSGSVHASASDSTGSLNANVSMSVSVSGDGNAALSRGTLPDSNADCYFLKVTLYLKCPVTSSGKVTETVDGETYTDPADDTETWNVTANVTYVKRG